MNHPGHRRLLVAAVVLVLAGCGQDAAPATATSQSDTSTLPPVSTAVSTEASDSGFATALFEFVEGQDGGVSAVIEEGGIVEVVTAGTANSGGDPITADTAFHMGSISKTFTATLIMRLVDEGRIDLDERLSVYLPDNEVGADTTIRSLLGHRSGIPSCTDHPDFGPELLADLTRSWEPAEMLEYVDAGNGGDAEPYSYSNTNFVLLGMLVERLHGTDLNSVLQAEIAEPLGLTRTVFAGGGVSLPGVAAPFVPGYPDSGTAGTPYESIASSAFAGGALVSTPTELRLFLRALLEGDLVSEPGLAEMTRPQSAYYGLGIEIMDLDGSPAWLGHGGAMPGYHAILAAHPETGQLLVIATNNDLLWPAEFVREFLSRR